MAIAENVTDRVPIQGHPALIAGVALAGAFVLVVVAFFLKGLTDHGMMLAGALAGRLAVVFFVAILVVQPLDRRFSFGFLRGLGKERGALTLAFAGVMTISLACLSAPMALSSASHA